jgi:hypothetical protein
MKAFYFYLILFAGIFFGCHVLEAQNVATGKDTVKAEYSGEKPILIFDSMRMMDSMPFSPMQISTSTLNSWLSFNVDRIFPPLSAVFQPPAPSPMSFFGWSSEFRYSRSSMTGILFNLTPRLSLSSSAALGLTDAPLTEVKENFYWVNVGAMYSLNPHTMFSTDMYYHSNYGVVPFWNVLFGASYSPYKSLLIESGVNYTRTDQNDLGIKQSSVIFNVHSRFMFDEDIYFNLFGGGPLYWSDQARTNPMPMMPQPHVGGTMEYWFAPKVAIEAGMVWYRSVFSKNMILRPVISLRINTSID